MGKSSAKRFFSFFMSIVMLFSFFDFSAIKVAAASASVKVGYYSFSYDFAGSGLSTIYGQFVKLTDNNKAAYCIQSDVDSGVGGSTLTKNQTDWGKYSLLTPTQKKNINYALMYGYIDSTRYGYTADEERIATQIVIWNICDGWFNNTNEKTALSRFTQNIPTSGNIKKSSVVACYGKIKSQVVNHAKTSCNGAVRSASYSNGKYTASFVDKNRLLNCFDWKTALSGSGISYSITTGGQNGDTITFTSSKPINKTITATKISGGYCSPKTNIKALALTGGDTQNVVTIFYGDYDPVKTELKINTPTGTGRVVKTWIHHNDAKQADKDIYFRIKNSDTGKFITASGSKGKYTYTSAKETEAKSTKLYLGKVTGEAKGAFEVLNMPEGNYTAYEYGSNANGTIPNYSRIKGGKGVNFTIKIGETAIVPFDNERNIGDLIVTKTWVHNNNSLISYATNKNSSGLKIAKYNNGKNAVTFRIYYKDSSGNKHYLKADDGLKIDEGVYKWNGTTATTSQQYFHLYQNYYTGSNNKKYDGFKVIDMPTGYAYFVEESAISGYVVSSNNISVSMTSKIGKNDYSPVLKNFTNTRETGTGQVIKTWVHHNDAMKSDADIFFRIKSKDTGKFITVTGKAGNYTYTSSNATEANSSRLELGKVTGIAEGAFNVLDMPSGDYIAYEYGSNANGTIPYYSRVSGASVTFTIKNGKTTKISFRNERNIGDVVVTKTWANGSGTNANRITYKATSNKSYALVDGKEVNFRIYYTTKNANGNIVKHYLKADDGNIPNEGVYKWSGETVTASQQYFKLYKDYYTENGVKHDGFKIIDMPTGYNYFVEEINVAGYIPDKNHINVKIEDNIKTGSTSYTPTLIEFGNSHVMPITIKKDWKPVEGSTISEATKKSLTNDIYFTIKNGGSYVIATGGANGKYVYSGLTSNASEATQFKAYYNSASDISFTISNAPYTSYVATEHIKSGTTTAAKFVATTNNVTVTGVSTTGTITNTEKGTAQVVKTWIHHNDAKQADKDIYFVIKNNDTGKFITASGSAGNYTFTGANETEVAKATQLKLAKVTGVVNGAFNVLGMPEGSYTAYEYGCNSYYTSVSGTSKSFKIVNGKVATVSFSNERNIGDLIVSKTWVHNGNSLISYQSTESLPYATLNGTPIYFKVYYETTDANGTVTRHYLKADDGDTHNEGAYKWNGETATVSQQYFKLYKDYYTDNGVKHDGFKISDMPTGYTYYVEEQTVKGYICSSNKISVTITSKVGEDAYTPVKKDVRNTRETGSASLHKVFSDDANLTAQQKAEQYKNTTFAVLYKGNNQYVKATGSNGAYTFSGYQTTATEFALNASGNFSISKLPSGSYRVVEIKWDSYNYNPKTTYVDITVENGKNTPVNFENIRTGYVLVKKNWTIPVGLDRSTKRITDLTKNTYFLIRDKSTNQYLTATTDNQSRYTYTGVTTKANATKFNAYVYIENNDISSISFSVNKLPLGNYVVEEITTGDANKYFIPDKTSIDITLTNAVPTNDSSFTNTEKGCATINKVWSDAGTGYATDAERNAVTFYIRNKATNVYIKASGSAGDYTFTGLGTTAISSGTGFKLSSSNTFLVKDLDAGTYIVSEVLAGSSKFAPRDEQEVTVANGEDNGVTFQNVVKAGALKVNKTWKAEVNTQANLQNLTSKVYFTLKFGNKYVVATKETNPAYRYRFAHFTADASKATKFTASVITQSGALVATFDVAGLPIGSYTVTETVTDKNVAHRFTASALSANVNVTYNATVTANFTNSESTGEIIKIWDDKNANTTEQERSKVQFVIKDTKTNKYIIAKQYATGDYEYTGFGTTDIASATLISLNANHTEAKITKLPEGTYTVIEMNCPSGYTASADQTLTIINGKLGTVKFTNTRDTGRLFIRKQWLSYKNLSTDKLTELSNNTYFTIACGSNYVQASNSNGVYSFTGYTTSVSNATQFKAIIVKDSTGKVTDNKFNVTGLPTGNYTIKEYTVNGSEANTNYIASSESQNITITKSVNNSTNSTKFINTEKGKANVTKTFTKKLNGTAFTDAELIALYDKVTFTVKKGNQYVTATGDNGNYVYSSLSNTAYTFKLSSTGKLAIENIPEGTYTITESCSDSAYKPTMATKSFTVVNGKITSIAFENLPVVGEGLVTKIINGNLTAVDKTNITTYYNNVKFKIKDTSTGKYVTATGGTSGTYYYSGNTDATGTVFSLNSSHKFAITRMPEGTYVAIEVSHSDGFNKAPDQTFTIKNGERTSLTFTNTREVAPLTIKKVWKTSEENTLTTAEKQNLVNNIYFTVQDSGGNYVIAPKNSAGEYVYSSTYATLSNNGKFKLDVDTNNILIKNLPTGTYTVTEHNKNKAYLMENEVQTITVKDEQASQLTFTNRAIKGSVSTTKKDADYPDVKLTGAIFTVYKAEENGYVEIGTLDEIKEGEYQLDNLYYGDYKLIETKAPEKFVRDTKEYKFSIDENSDGVVINIETEAGKGFENQPYRGTVRVTKIDKDYPENKLTGAEFTIYAEDKTTVIGTLTETKKGVYTYEDLRFGNYYLKETVAPENFILDNKFHSFKIEEDGEIVDVETKAGKGLANSAMTGTLNITKKSADGVIEGWKFRITSVDVPTLPEGVSYDETFTTDAEGKISVTLRIGTYKVEEVTTGVTGYLFPDAKDIEIKWNEDTDTEMENTPYGKIVLNKVDEFKNDVLVSGAVYAVYKDVNENGAYDEDVDTFVDNLNDGNGIYSLDKVKYGKYIVKETKSPEGYLLDNNAYPVDINEANAERHIYNTVTDDGTSIYIEEVVTGTVQVTKVDKDYPENKLTGAEFTIYASDKTTVIGTLTETEKGIYTYEGLRYGNYFLKETKAPENFVLDEDFHAFSITEDGKIVDIETKAGKGLENSAMTGTLNITKKSADGVLEGWKFRITSIDVPTLPEGVSYDETFTTDAEGKISVALRIGTYKVEEVTTGVTGYLFPDAKDIEIKWNENTDAEMENTPYGKIVLNKVDEFNTITYVAGAVYAVYKDVNENKTYEEDIDTFVSNLNEVEEGVYVLDKAEYGNYLVKEVKAPKGYLVDKNYYPISIGEAGAEVPVFNEKEKDTDAPIFVETPITGNVEITKIDEDYPDEKLSGAEFTIFEKDKKTEVGKLTEVEKGVYRYEGLRYGEYYLQETKAPKYFIRDVNFYYFEIVNNGETVTIANDELGKGTFINSPEAGEIKIVKTSYNNKVDGFTFEIKGTAYTGQEYCEQFITDKNGIISVKGLRAGRYTIHEVRNEATKGYILPADEELTIERLGDVAVANMYNGDNPKTGVLGDDNVLPIATFAAFVGTGIILITPTAKRKRKYRVIRTHKK